MPIVMLPSPRAAGLVEKLSPVIYDNKIHSEIMKQVISASTKLMTLIT